MAKTQSNLQTFLNLVKPSVMSATIAVLAGLVLTGGVLIAFATSNSSVQQQILAWRPQPAQKTLTTPDQTLPENDHPTLKGSWPLLIVWSAIGLAVYAVSVWIIHSLKSAKDLSEEVNYVNAKHKVQLETAFEHFVLRFVSFAILIVLSYLLVKQVVPYSITAAYASSLDIVSGNGLLYAILSFAIVVVTVHLQTIFLRLTFGKVRVF